MKAEFETKSCDEWKIKIAKSFEEVEAIRDIWMQMQRDESVPALNTDIDRYLSVMESLKETAQPYIIVLYYKSDPKAIVIGRIETRRIRCRVGYATIFKPSLRCLTILYGGILGQPSEQTSVRLLQELTNILKQGDIDTVFFNQLQLDSPIYRLSRKKPYFLCRCYSPVVEPHWQTYLPDSVKAFYKEMSGSRKRYLRRYTRALEKVCSGPVEMVCYRSEDKIDHVISIASEISAKTYKNALNVGFRDDYLTRLLLTRAAKQGSLRAYVLYAGGEPCAFEYGIEYGNVFFPEHIGYDPFFRSCSPGTVLFIKVVEDLIENSNVRVFDYGFGAAAYKERFGTESWPEASVYIFAPRLYPVIINILQSSVGMINTILHYIVQKLGSVSWLKRRWRDSLQTKKPDTKYELET
ncbi:MAG: GNAT family N-acetyltransferase [Sedimentisphaerales bacterium]|nr:GNAT family N-acetyltransferase [Sedimentisphaerales bacterium]